MVVSRDGHGQRGVKGACEARRFEQGLTHDTTAPMLTDSRV